jgi:uncharacterized tellurite resistance protein B-like protein
MFNYLKQIFSAGGEQGEKQIQPHEEIKFNEEKKLQIATCALFVEMAKADNEFTDDERRKIIKVMKETFNLEKEYVDELIELSEEELKDSVSIYEFTTVINESFSKEEKFNLLKNLWRLIYIDKTLNAHEDYLIKTIGATLNMEHRDIIAAKLLVKEEKKID